MVDAAYTLSGIAIAAWVIFCLILVICFVTVGVSFLKEKVPDLDTADPEKVEAADPEKAEATEPEKAEATLVVEPEKAEADTAAKKAAVVLGEE